jgi:hypothetical protein
MGPASGRRRDPVLVQRGPVAQRVARVLAAVVGRPRSRRHRGVVQPAGSHACAPAERPPRVAHDADRRPARRPVRDRDRSMARPRQRHGELLDVVLVRGSRDHPRRLALPPVHEPAERGPGARLHRPDDRARHLPDLLPGDHRPRPDALDRQGVRGGRDGPRGHADPRGPSDPAPHAVPGDLRERCDRVRRRPRRLRDRRLPQVGGRDRNLRDEDLLGLARFAHARDQRRRHVVARRVARRRGVGAAGVPTVQQGPARGRRRELRSARAATPEPHPCITRRRDRPTRRRRCRPRGAPAGLHAGDAR